MRKVRPAASNASGVSVNVRECGGQTSTICSVAWSTHGFTPALHYFDNLATVNGEHAAGDINKVPVPPP